MGKPEGPIHVERLSEEVMTVEVDGITPLYSSPLEREIPAPDAG